MKKLVPRLFSLLLTIYSINVSSTNCSAILNGDWSNPATWSCGRVPHDNDTISISTGIDVTMDINSPLYVNMLVIIDGNLIFDVGQKLNIAPGGVYISASGSVSGGNHGSKIIISGITYWNGPDVVAGIQYWGSSLLPVELLSFTGELKSDHTVELAWVTASEKNNNYFSIERSTNGLTFEEIGRVNGFGTSSMEHSYSLSDPQPATGTNYYRLRQTDNDGQSELLKIIAVEILGDSNGCVLTVFPNPCQGMCTVNFTDCPEDKNGTINLEMINANGTVVSQQIPARNAEGGFTTTIDATDNLKPGVYIVRGNSSKKTYMNRAVIK